MRALISVYDKTGIVDFATGLRELDITILSTGGTYEYLQQNGVETEQVSDVTNQPAILGGRVKTLHPRYLAVSWLIVPIKNTTRP
jgi:phosphoribosylaminoimidazolecarboxamide formyltransferase/IMP cyclohydrolase